jgi:transcription elongation factor Elf1
MPLSATLRTINLTFECPRCGHAFVNTGNWFMTTGRFTCEGCGCAISLTYDDKRALFDKHAHLS